MIPNSRVHTVPSARNPRSFEAAPARSADRLRDLSRHRLTPSNQIAPSAHDPAAPDNGSFTILRERISTWVLIDILELFHRLSTLICKLYLALIHHICSIKPLAARGPNSGHNCPDITRMCGEECCSEARRDGCTAEPTAVVHFAPGGRRE